MATLNKDRLWKAMKDPITPKKAWGCHNCENFYSHFMGNANHAKCVYNFQCDTYYRTKQNLKNSGYAEHWSLDVK